jgi:glycine cleavage system aminomethyltransferase T
MIVHEPSGTRASVKSAGYGHTVGKQIFSAYLPAEVAKESEFEVEIANVRYPVRRHDAPLYDPKGASIRR